MALFGALVAGGVTSGFDLLVGERILGRAIRLEAANTASMPLTHEPFSRSEQRAGLVMGELVFGIGVAFLLAATAIFLASADRSARHLWLLMTAACVWAVVLLPAFAYPPVPPGVESGLAIEWRQLGYVLTIAVGLTCFTAAVRVWRLAGRLRPLGRSAIAVATAAVPATLVVLLLPDQRARVTVSDDLLRDFRLVSWGGQLLFWASLGLVGWLLLGVRRAAAASC